MARTAADCAVLLQAMAGADPRDPAAAPRANFDIEKAAAAPRLGVIRPFFFATADREVAALSERAIAVLESHGAHPVEIGLPESFAEVHVMHRRLMAAEAADFHWAHFTTQPGEYGPHLAALLIEGLDTSMADYQEALRHQVGFQNALVPLLADVDALVTPATVSAAPGLETTGDPRFNSPWSYAGLPTVSIPCALTAAGLPISLQLIGPAWSEAKLLAIAAWCEQRLAFDALPTMCQR